MGKLKESVGMLKKRIAALETVVEELEYRVIYYPTKDEAMAEIRLLERTIADPADWEWIGEGRRSDPSRGAREDLEAMLKYAHKRGWIEGREGKE